MSFIVTLLALIVIGGLVGIAGYYTTEGMREFINGGFIFIKEIIDSIPQLFATITTLANYLFNFIGFFLTHIPFMFMITQIFFMFMAMTSQPEFGNSKSFNMIKVYLECNRKLFSFLHHLFMGFINLIINITKAIGNVIPLT